MVSDGFRWFQSLGLHIHVASTGYGRAVVFSNETQRNSESPSSVIAATTQTVISCLNNTNNGYFDDS